MNPILLDNPVAAGQMPTTDSLHSAFSRRKLAVLPRLPIDYNKVILQPEYKIAENVHRFLLFQESFPIGLRGILDNHILYFGARNFFKKMYQATVVHVDGTLKVCPAPYQQLFTICSFHHDDNEGYGDNSMSGRNMQNYLRTAVIYSSTAVIYSSTAVICSSSVQAQQNDETSNETSNGIESLNSIMKNRRRIKDAFYPSTCDMHIQQREQLTKIDYR